MSGLVSFLEMKGQKASCDRMPPSPDRACALYAQALREPGDSDGSSVLIHFRGERASDSSQVDAQRAWLQLRDFEGYLHASCPPVCRVELESPPQSAGLDAAQRPFHAMTLRIYQYPERSVS